MDKKYGKIMSEAVVTNKPINRIINAPGTCTSNILTSNEVKAVIQDTVGNIGLIYLL